MSTTEENNKRSRKDSSETVSEESPSSKRVRKPKVFDDFDLTPSSPKKNEENVEPIIGEKKIERRGRKPKGHPKTPKEQKPKKEKKKKVDDSMDYEHVDSETPKKKKPGRPKKSVSSSDDYAPPPNVITDSSETSTNQQVEKRPQRPHKAPKPVYEPHVSDELRLLSESHQQCYKILESLMLHHYSWPFLQPVDPVALNIPDYLDIIKTPMDLSTIKKKLLSGKYETIQEFAIDIRLVWQNCFTYNPPTSDVVKMAQDLDQFFETRFKKVVEEINGEYTQKKMAEMQKKMKEMEKELLLHKSGGSAVVNSESPITEEIKVTPVKIQKEVKRKRATPVVDSRPMSFEEKKLLSANIGQLDPIKLTKIVDIIQSRAPKASSQSVEQEIEIDLDKLDAVTLRQIEKYIKTTLTGSKKKNYVKTSKSLSTPPSTTTSTSSLVKQETVTQQQLPPPPQTISNQEQNTKLESSSSDSDSSSSDSDSDDEKNSNAQEDVCQYYSIESVHSLKINIKKISNNSLKNQDSVKIKPKTISFSFGTLKNKKDEVVQAEILSTTIEDLDLDESKFSWNFIEQDEQKDDSQDNDKIWMEHQRMYQNYKEKLKLRENYLKKRMIDIVQEHEEKSILEKEKEIEEEREKEKREREKEKKMLSQTFDDDEFTLLESFTPSSLFKMK
eukprot:gene199-4445_t